MISTTRHAMIAIVLSALALTVLSGCALPSPRLPAHPAPDHASAAPTSESPGSSARASPPVGTDAETFSKAASAYRAYARTMDVVSADGGKRPERIDEVVTARFASTLHVAFASMRHDGIRTVGRTRILGIRPVDYQNSGAHRPLVRLRACLDLGGTRVLDQAGTDITPPDRQDRVLYQVFVTSADEGTGFVVADARNTGKEFCS